MFSFFKSSKKSPIASPSEPAKIEDHVQRGADGFEIIGGSPAPAPLYPSAQLPQPPVPAASPGHSQFNRQYSLQQANYTNNVPFKLNPALSSNGNESEFFEYKLREINQMMTNVANSRDYDFKLERSIVEQT